MAHLSQFVDTRYLPVDGVLAMGILDLQPDCRQNKPVVHIVYAPIRLPLAKTRMHSAANFTQGKHIFQLPRLRQNCSISSAGFVVRLAPHALVLAQAEGNPRLPDGPSVRRAGAADIERSRGKGGAAKRSSGILSSLLTCVSQG